jgi:hypothetical protein
MLHLRNLGLHNVEMLLSMLADERKGKLKRHVQPRRYLAFNVIGGSARHSRTGMPRSRIRSFACCTVYSP